MSELDDLYRERAHLVAFLAAQYPSVINVNADPDAPGWPVLFIATPQGQLSWHIAPTDMDLFAHVLHGSSMTWDGHTTAEKYARLRSLTSTHSRIANGGSSAVTAGDHPGG